MFQIHNGALESLILSNVIMKGKLIAVAYSMSTYMGTCLSDTLISDNDNFDNSRNSFL